jgi:hypothetical protein
LSQRLEPVVRDLRLGASAAALAAFADFIGEFTAILPSLTDKAGVLDTLMPMLDVALAAQERSDYLGLADVLEYELRPLLDGVGNSGSELG